MGGRKPVAAQIAVTDRRSASRRSGMPTRHTPAGFPRCRPLASTQPGRVFARSAGCTPNGKRVCGSRRPCKFRSPSPRGPGSCQHGPVDRHEAAPGVNVFERAAGTYGTVGPDFFVHFGRRLVDGSGSRGADGSSMWPAEPARPSCPPPTPSGLGVWRSALTCQKPCFAVPLEPQTPSPGRGSSSCG